MLLGAGHIEREIAAGHLLVSPFSPDRLKSASYVLSLGGRFRRWRRRDAPIRLWTRDAASEHLEDPMDADAIVLHSGEFMLGCTTERIGLPAGLFGTLSPLSHIARFGLTVHGGADFINPGFGASQPTAITLELANFNASPIELTAGMPIAHLRIGRVEDQAIAVGHARSIYEGADPVTAPRLYEEWGEAIQIGGRTRT